MRELDEQQLLEAVAGYGSFVRRTGAAAAALTASLGLLILSGSWLLALACVPALLHTGVVLTAGAIIRGELREAGLLEGKERADRRKA